MKMREQHKSYEDFENWKNSSEKLSVSIGLLMNNMKTTASHLGLKASILFALRLRSKRNGKTRRKMMVATAP
jgi:hypothetical protein